MVRISSKVLNAVSPYKQPININLLKPTPQIARDGSNKKLKLADYFINKTKHKSHDYDIVYGAPTIYNHEKSSSNSKGIIKAMRALPAGIYYSPAESSTYGLTFSEVIPKSFLVENDISKELYESLPHNIENKKRDIIDFKHAPVLKSKKDYEEENQSIPTDLTKLFLSEEKVEKCKKLLANKATYEKVSELINLPVSIIKYIGNSIPARELKLEDHATYKEDEAIITELFNKHNVKHL
ncbi:hypothetical protein FOG51_02926 [Hanseniaspora uvarum]|nr:hypothetical protein FOG51_02926 [Hanseniaspora uvarum]GMM41490.1 hypothetical protein DAHU10_024000 [Hanseniaspora uvarum]